MSEEQLVDSMTADSIQLDNPSDDAPEQVSINTSQLRTNVIVGILLTIIVLIGGYFRFVGSNWDDFTNLHPDERFLTLNLLPQLGGALEFTPDEETFPTHAILTRAADGRFVSYRDIVADATLRLGGVSAGVNPDAARWLVGDDRAIAYNSGTALLQALQNGEIDAAIVDQTVASTLTDGTQTLESLSSQEMQRQHCLYTNADSAGHGGYFDTACSPLNPHNAGQGFYTYGTLPLFMAHFASNFVQVQETAGIPFFDYQSGTLVWRAISAFFDIGSILLTFWIATRLHNKWVGLLAAVLYAAAVLPIQKAHFGTVNSVTAFFVMLAILFAVYVQLRGNWLYYIGFGIATGASVAGRINTAPLAGVVVLAAILQCVPVLDSRLSWGERQRILTHHVIGLILSGITTFIAFRIFNPYAFVGPGFLGILPNERWLANISSGSYGVSGHQDSPPNWQWLGRPSYLYPLSDMFLWGMGIAYGLIAWFGWVWSGWQITASRLKSTRNMLLFVWILVYFAWIGRLWVMTMRYYLPLYSSLAILGAWSLYELHRHARERDSDLPLTRIILGTFATILGGVFLYHLVHTNMTFTAVFSGVIALILLLIAILPLLNRQRALILTGFVVSFTLLWAVMFTSIYRSQLTRVQGSRWIFENVAGDFAIQVEGAPEGTPLINIALPNVYATSSDDLVLQRATQYLESAPSYYEFVAPADGKISTIYAPHLGDPLDDSEPETLFISISEARQGATPVTATFTHNFTRDDHVLGNAYEIPLEREFTVVEGTHYNFKVELIEGGSLIGSGSVVLTEGDWDDRLTTTQICTLPDGLTLADDPPSGLVGYDDCNGQQSWHALVNSYDMAMSYPVDNDLKRDSIIGALDVGDYLTISSNRFYDTLTRNQLRWPLSTEYYDLLFAGELGYELIGVFHSQFELGPLSVSDQHLPIYDSPQWFNEFEADEAFHVYDHPAVFIFRKTEDYSNEQVRRLLEAVPILQVDEVVSGADSTTMAGVVYWSSLEAEEAPTGLYLRPEDAKAQQTGGTWSDRFHSDSVLNTIQPLGLIVWWLTIILFGLVTFPLSFALFPRMADRGYGFSKFIGLLIVGWLAWVLGSLKLPFWSQGGIFACLLILAGLSGVVAWNRRAELREFVSHRWGRLAWIELLSLILFIAFIGVRLSNPDLWHFAKGGEKPMDFAYFNAVLRSTVFPAYDPWHSGGFMNYYYYGFVLVGSPVLLLGIVPSFAYNLIIPTIFSVTGMGAFSAAFNITSSWRVRRNEDDEPQKPKTYRRKIGNPWAAGIAAMLLCVVLGNLDTVRVLGNGIARLGGYETPTGLENFLVQQYVAKNGESPPPEIALELTERAARNGFIDSVRYEIDNSVSLMSGLATGLGRAIGGEPLPIGSDRWYWGPSRVLAETPGVGGNAITEMPYFTFLYGDLHAHMISMPFLLFTIFFLFNELLMARDDSRTRLEGFLSLAIGAGAVGLIQATNTWDWPAFLLFSTIGLGYAWWLRWEVISRRSLTHMTLFIGGFITMSFAAALPHTSWYAATYNSVQLWEGGKTPLWAYFDIHGAFLFLIFSLFIWETGRWLRAVKVKSLRGQGMWIVTGLIFSAFMLVLTLILTLAGYQVALIAVPMILWIVPLFFRPGQSIQMQYLLVIAGLALSMTLGVEIIVIGGDIGRQNTVFKFYMQTWMLFSVVGGVAFAVLVEHSEYWTGRVRWLAPFAFLISILTMFPLVTTSERSDLGEPGILDGMGRISLRTLWYVPLVILFTIAAMFPLMATRGRAVDRMAPDMPLTLNGMDYMQYSEHYETDAFTQEGEMLDLSYDYKIIRWLQENVEGTPVIMEGRRYPSEYQWNGRIAINTGLPAVLGWSFHQRQQRTFDPLPRLVDQRAANISAFYTTGDVNAAVDIIWHYDVSYIIISEMERVHATSEGLIKFEQMVQLGLLEVVFEDGPAVIYKVVPDALERFVQG